MSLFRSSFSILLLAALLSSAHASPQLAQLVSKPVDPDFFDGFGNANSDGCRFSDDGQRMVFHSDAFNLFEDDDNGDSDVFVFDRSTETLELISRTAQGDPASGFSLSRDISGNGRYVLMRSQAPDLGSDASEQGFRHDLETGLNVAVGFAPDGSEFNTVGPETLTFDGRHASFNADSQAWLRDIEQGTTTMISIGIDDQPANESAFGPRVSSDGSIVVFNSAASNLVADDSNGERDLFVRDLVLATTTRIEGAGGVEPDGESSSARLSADGRWVTFISSATNLVVGDTNSEQDVFLYDRVDDALIRLSEDSNGTGGNARSRNPAISADGRFVIFESDADNLVPGLVGIDARLFLYDRNFGTLVRIAEFTEAPYQPCIYNSGNEGWIAYGAKAHPLIPESIQHRQIVLEPFESFDPDRESSSTFGATAIAQGGDQSSIITRRDPPLPVEVANGDSQSPDVAGSGRFVVFQTNAGNLIGESPGGRQIVRLDRQTGELILASLGDGGEPVDFAWPPTKPSVDANGNRVVFLTRAANLVPGDTNDLQDLFVRDLGLGQTARISMGNNDDEANGESENPVISANGGSVAFESEASNLVADDTNGRRDIFVRDFDSPVLERVSISTENQEFDAHSESPDINATGRFVVFSSSGDLKDGPGPFPNQQIWLRDRQAGTTELISATADGQPGNGRSDWPKISVNGRWIAFRSRANNLDPAFPGVLGASIYLHDRQTGESRLVSLDRDGQPVPVMTGNLVEGPMLAPDGSALMFQRFITPDGTDGLSGLRGSDPEGTIYLFDRVNRQTTIIDPVTTDGLPPDEQLIPAAVEPGGRVIYLVSTARNLTPGMVTSFSDVYRIDLDFDRLFEDRFQTHP